MNRQTLTRLWRNDVLFSIASTACMLVYIGMNRGHDKWGWALSAFILCNLRLLMILYRRPRA